MQDTQGVPSETQDDVWGTLALLFVRIGLTEVDPQSSLQLASDTFKTADEEAIDTGLVEALEKPSVAGAGVFCVDAVVITKEFLMANETDWKIKAAVLFGREDELLLADDTDDAGCVSALPVVSKDLLDVEEMKDRATAGVL